jgi:hypothetical protein
VYDEIVVADTNSGRVVVFNPAGELLKTLGRGDFTGAAIHGGTIVVQDYDNQKCVLFK